MMTALLVLVVLLGTYVLLYNGLAVAVTKVEQGWAGIEVQLKRRHDLTPQLVSAVRGAMRHETEIFDAVLAARTRAVEAMASHDPAVVGEAEATLGQSLQRLIGYAEDTPEITAAANIGTFQRQLEETEDQIAAARRLYNGNVQNLNARLVTFPGNIVGGLHRFRQAVPFALEETERRAALAAPAITL